MSSHDERISRLEAQVERLLGVVAERDAEIARLRVRVADLEAKLGQNSTNSHKPPSSDPPGTRSAKKPTGRKRGGQPGHKPHRRELLPPELVTNRTEVVPSECDGCGSTHVHVFADARVHQVVDIPEPKPEVQEFAMYGVLCSECGEETWASLPDGVPPHMFGPRLLALIGYMAGARISRRQARELLLEVFGVPVSLGALSEAEERTSNAIAAPVEAAFNYARAQAVKHVDATTWRLAGAMRTLWTIATSVVTVFGITAEGSAAAFRELLGTLAGILVSDRGSPFGFWVMERRQVCWAHLIRKFVSFTERDDEGARLGRHLLLFAQYMLSRWHRVRDGTLSRARFKGDMALVRVAIENLLARGEALRRRGISGACRDILDHKEALFTFIDMPGVDPTNNAAERALRPFVIWRKVSYGSQSERGCLFAQRIMTVFQTLRKQRRSVFAFLVDACHAAQHGGSTPALVPRIG